MSRDNAGLLTPNQFAPQLVLALPQSRQLLPLMVIAELRHRINWLVSVFVGLGPAVG